MPIVSFRSTSHFIFHREYPGWVVAAMFAAAMSSIDSGVNSISAVVMTDFVDRFRGTASSGREHIQSVRWLAFGIGAIVVAGSSLMKYVPGNITAVTAKTSNLLTTPIFCLFFFALFVPFASRTGVWVGAICGTATAAVIAFSGPLVVLLTTQFGVDPALFGVEVIAEMDPISGEAVISAADPISFQYIAPAAVLVNIGLGLVVSWLIPGKSSDKPLTQGKGDATGQR